FHVKHCSNEWRLEFAAKGFGKDGGHEGIEFAGIFGLKFLYSLDFSLQIVEVCDDAALLVDGRQTKLGRKNVVLGDVELPFGHRCSHGCIQPASILRMTSDMVFCSQESR